MTARSRFDAFPRYTSHDPSHYFSKLENKSQKSYTKQPTTNNEAITINGPWRVGMLAIPIIVAQLTKPPLPTVVS